jgi:hypothetical protein
MRKLDNIAVILLLLILGIGGYWGFTQVRRHFDPFERMKAGVIRTSEPLSLSAARARSDCPIALPETATNIQYAVWSLWQASQTFVRFEAPVTDCLKHAEAVMQPYAQRAGVNISPTNVVGPLPAPSIVSPKDLTVDWFDLPHFSAGVQFQVNGARAPTVWVDTNRGCFYYAWDE